MKRIPLTQGKFALVDDCDYEWLCQWKWYYKSGYAIRHDYTMSIQKSIYMYKVVLTLMGVTLKKRLNVRWTLDYRRYVLVPPLDLSPGPKRIPLTQGKFTIVDDRDYEYLMQWRWCYDGEYATRGNFGRLLKMHRVILERQGLHSFDTTDHGNGNKLDNRRVNLRPATFQQNGMNQIPQKGRSSQYKGVAWDKARGKWLAYIKHSGRHIHLGRFENEEEAARTYNKAAKKHFGKFACLNKI